MSKQIIELTQQLLDSIVDGDWETYEKLCDPSLTCFEPEADGHLVHGMGFHKFYFENRVHHSDKPKVVQNTTISSPHVRMIGDSVAIISYVRLIQKQHPRAGNFTKKFEETRVWEKQDGQWKHVHFHRSRPGGHRIGWRGMAKKYWKMRGGGHGNKGGWGKCKKH